MKQESTTFSERQNILQNKSSVCLLKATHTLLVVHDNSFPIFNRCSGTLATFKPKKIILNPTHVDDMVN